MNNEDCKKTELIAEVKVRQFFEHYLNEIFPEQLTQLIAAHDNDVRAHRIQIREAIRVESYRVKLWLIGLIFAGGVGGGLGIREAVAFFVGN